MLNADSGHIGNGINKFYDPIERAEETAQIVCKGNKRKYYRFRPARFYGGIGTADCLGCCLRCLFCWSWDKVVRPGRYGKFYSPQQVAGRLTTIAYKKGFRQVRISGNEPTLARDHLLHVLEQIPGDIRFILETNGILIGHDSTYARDLSRFGNLYVRVSVKGTGEAEFSRLTGADSSGFGLQLGALENLVRFNVATHPAVMVSFSSPENIKDFKRRLREIHKDFEDFEVEELVLYGTVEERLIKAGLSYNSAYEPECIPPRQV
ncbi:MAG: radical SAM protein [Desulfobacteraceae bacterium]|nr:radical SAM protein [Desulfobacteraceae bacterium]